MFSVINTEPTCSLFYVYVLSIDFKDKLLEKFLIQKTLNNWHNETPLKCYISEIFLYLRSTIELQNNTCFQSQLHVCVERIFIK